MACFLEIFRPDGQRYNPNEQENGKYPLSEIIKSSGKTEIIIGREDKDIAGESTDIRLPANDKKISRKHCSIEIEDNYYFRVKSIKKNITHLRKANRSDQDIYFVDEENTGYQLRHGDQILILSNYPVQDNPYWTCYFYDDNETEQANTIICPYQTKYCYELTSMKLYIKSNDGQSKEIKLAGNPLKLVDYLAKKVVEHNYNYIAKYDDLISAIWGDTFGKSADDLHNLKAQIRTKIVEATGKNASELIEVTPKHGYRLNCRVIGLKISE
jgi:DNA-binding winged helix-turn-helix (wHTH) protein